MPKLARFDVRITQKEKGLATKAAKRLDLSLAEFIRRAMASYAEVK